MKKIIYIFFIMILVMAMASGCGGNADNTKPADENTQMESENQETEESSQSIDTDSLGDKLASTYIRMMEDEKYFMRYKASIDMEGQQLEVEAAIAVSGDDTALVTKGNGMESTMISKGDTTYMVDHQSQTVFVISEIGDEGDETIDTEGITYIGSGTEGGLSYEEYATEDGTLKYFFDGKDLVRITVEIEGVTTAMDILEMSNQIPAGIFDVPEGYEKITM